MSIFYYDGILIRAVKTDIYYVNFFMNEATAFINWGVRDTWNYYTGVY
jgi:hypothetical protein